MIHKFHFKNFFSFKDEATVDFTVSDNAPNKQSYILDYGDKRISKILGVFGPNASGKTNFLKVLPFLKWWMCNSFSIKPDEEIRVMPFIFKEKLAKSASFYVEFSLDSKTLLKYSVELNAKTVLFEELKQATRKKDKIIFNRKWNEETNKYTYNLKNFDVSNDFPKMARKNASILSAAIQIQNELSLGILAYWDKLVTNVDQGGQVGHPEFLSLSEATEELESKPEVLKEITDLLTQFDLGLSGIKIKELFSKDEKDSIKIPFGLHLGDKFELPFMYESGGTKNLFFILRNIISVIQNGGIAVLDEFDANLHPHMVGALLNLFKKSSHSKAQFLFSTHSAEALAQLDKYQIMFVEKSEKGESQNWRLDEIGGVRSDENFYAKYLSGRYGAIPNL